MQSHSDAMGLHPDAFDHGVVLISSAPPQALSITSAHPILNMILNMAER
jgi:hypothetical protein